MKRKIFLICVLLIVSMMVASNYKYLKHEEQEHKIKESNIAIMVYDDEIDNYVKQSNVPKGAKYSLNEELTKCEAGGKVTEYSKVYGTLKYELNRADYCYVYFDVDNTPSYAIYSETDNSLIFYKNNDEVGSEYNGRVVTAKYDDIENSIYKFNGETQTPNTPWYEYADTIKIISVANDIAPISTDSWFAYLQNVESINLTNLDTQNVISMGTMFAMTGYNKTNFTINLGDKFDTSNVTNMSSMFHNCGFNSEVVQLNLGDKFDTSNVTTMYSLFAMVGRINPNFTLDLGDKFDTSNVTRMDAMFNNVGRMNPNFTLDLGDKFDTSQVTSMYYMFQSVGYSNSNFTLNMGNKFDTKETLDMKYMFNCTGRSNPNFELDLSNFIVQSSCQLTYFASYSASKIILGEGWANATLVSGMFKRDTSTPLEIVNAPANVLAYDFANDNRVVTFTTI